MKIDGRAIASHLLANISQQVETLKAHNIFPHVVIIVVGSDPASLAYVRQKIKKAEEVGIKTTLIPLPETIKQTKLLEVIKKYNDDPLVHGIIVQRPLPEYIDTNAVTSAVSVKKDIDAFHTDSPYVMPLAGAVMAILDEVKLMEHRTDQMIDWLKHKNIVIIGKGPTAGGPTIKLLQKKGIMPHIIDSKTTNREETIGNADIIISAVGKSHVIQKETIKPGVILVSVGMHRGNDLKLHGDYEEEDIQNKASFYTPTPGGVGPVNVAMLLQNLIIATEK